MITNIANILWFILGGGAIAGIGWWCFSILAMISIVGIPWAKACFVIGKFSFFPFGKEALSREIVYQRSDVGTGIFGSLGNIIWFFLQGFGCVSPIYVPLLHALSQSLAYHLGFNT